jgi:PAS domain-containing protein
MRKSEAKFKAVFDNAAGGILLLDQHLSYLEVNPAMCELLNRSRTNRGSAAERFYAAGNLERPGGNRARAGWKRDLARGVSITQFEGRAGSSGVVHLRSFFFPACGWR